MKQQPAQHDLILSISVDAVEEEKPEMNKSRDQNYAFGLAGKEKNIRNMVIHHIKGQYYLDHGVLFDSAKALINYYLNHTTDIGNGPFKLQRGVRQQVWEFRHSELVFDNDNNLLGSGAYGEVRKGTINMSSRGGQPNVVVAVKMLKGVSEANKEMIKEMMREAQTMRNLNHKNVVRLFDAAVFEQPIYIIVEFVEGGELRKYLMGKKGEITLIERLNIILGSCLGIEYLHFQGCMHRDIATRNVLYSEDSDAKISDFGLTRHSFQYKVNKNFKLPIKWLAPESPATNYYTLKSDVYSIGALTVEVFTDGNPPWGNMKMAAVRVAIMAGKYMPVPEEMPKKLRNFIHKHIFCPAEMRTDMAQFVKVVQKCLDKASSDCFA